MVSILGCSKFKSTYFFLNQPVGGLQCINRMVSGSLDTF